MQPDLEEKRESEEDPLSQHRLAAFRGKIQRLSYAEAPASPTLSRVRTRKVSIVSAVQKLEDRAVLPGTLSDSESLPWLKELVYPDLRCVFVGYNPSIMSSKRGHRYAHPTNQFWSLLYQSEIVPEKLTPYSDSIMPERYRLGFTDLVARPTRRASDLSREEMIQGALILEERITRNKPKCVCIVGKGIWECIMRARGTKVGKDFEWGLQNAILGQSAVFVVPSTSGLVAAITRERKLEIWRELAGFLNTLE